MIKLLRNTRENKVIMEELITRKVDNRKITPDLDWADFRGFSLLFDNPGNHLRPISSNLSVIDCQLQNARELKFYNCLHNALQSLNVFRMRDDWQFCMLPESSYHVTAWDGLNDFNRGDINGVLQSAANIFFKNFAPSFAADNPLTQPMYESLMRFEGSFPLTFKFGDLQQWGNQSLVATLLPADDSCREKLADFVQERINLNVQYEQYGVRMKNHFAPHVSLGYFANSSLAKETWQHLPYWQECFREYLQDCTITFTSMTGYGFTNMTTFFKRIV